MSALLVVLNVGACIAKTDVCPPPGSTTTGQIAQMGGQVVVVPSQPMRALGAEFRAGANLTVNVVPWHSSDGTRGAIVHVTGELAKESVVSGARVAGTVTIGQLQGRPGKPVLVAATDIKGGRITFARGSVELATGMTLAGHVDIGRTRFEIASPQPLRALGLDFEAGTLRLEQDGAEVTVTGTLARAQEVDGVLVTKQLRVRLGGATPVFEDATLARPTPLQALGLPDGEAPPGTIVRRTPAPLLLGPGPFTVCGIALAPSKTAVNGGLTFQPETASKVAVRGTLVGSDVDVGGVFMSGDVTLRFVAGSCKRAGIEGVLSRPSRHAGLELAAKAAFSIGEHEGAPLVIGTLAKPAVVDGLSITGRVIVQDVAGRLTVLDATLAKPAVFEAWELPAGAKLHRFPGGWQFETGNGAAARARAAYLGTQLDHVTQARRDDRLTALTFARPQPVGGIAMTSVAIDHASGCMTGGVGSPQRSGIFEIPKDGSATVCGGALVAAEGTYAVPSLRVGTWFATHAIAGDPKTPPAANPVPPKAKGRGFWIQINSLCEQPAGIPTPPPPQRWIFVDDKGTPVARADHDELAKRAAAPGKPCPQTACCPP